MRNVSQDILQMGDSRIAPTKRTAERCRGGSRAARIALWNKGLIISSSLMGILILASCVYSTQKPKVELVSGQLISLPTLGQLHLIGTATQIVTANYTINGLAKSSSSEMVIESTPKKLTLLALSPLGNTLFSVVYDGHIIQSSHLPIPHGDIGIQHALSDFLLAYAPTNVVQTMLAQTDLNLQTNPKQRLIIENKKVIMQIDYTSTNPWQGKVVIHNIPLNYTITVQTVATTLQKG
jgi:hypothetical protein